MVMKYLLLIILIICFIFSSCTDSKDQSAGFIFDGIYIGRSLRSQGIEKCKSKEREEKICLYVDDRPGEKSYNNYLIMPEGHLFNVYHVFGDEKGNIARLFYYVDERKIETIFTKLKKEYGEPNTLTPRITENYARGIRERFTATWDIKGYILKLDIDLVKFQSGTMNLSSFELNTQEMKDLKMDKAQKGI